MYCRMTVSKINSNGLPIMKNSRNETVLKKYEIVATMTPNCDIPHFRT